MHLSEVKKPNEVTFAFPRSAMESQLLIALTRLFESTSPDVDAGRAEVGAAELHAVAREFGTYVRSKGYVVSNVSRCECVSCRAARVAS